MKGDRNGSSCQPSGTAGNRGNTGRDKERSLALIISLDPKNTSSILEATIEANSRKPQDDPNIPQLNVDMRDYDIRHLSDLGAVVDFMHQAPETLASVGLVAFYDSYLDNEVVSVMIERLCSLLNPETIKAHYAGNGKGPKLISFKVDKQSFETKYKPPEVDPLYGHVRLTFREGKTVMWSPGYVIKTMHDDLGTGLSVGDIALLNEEAMRFYKFGVPTFADLNSGRVFMEHVGLISYELLREIRAMLKHANPRKGDKGLIRELNSIKHHLVYTQLIKLAEHQQNPFVPRKEDGNDINVTSNLREYYTKTLAAALNCETDTVRREAFDISIRGILAFLFNTPHEVRYMDMYQRNHGIHHPEVSSLDGLRSTLFKLPEEKNPEFFKEHFKQVDVHRIMRTALDLEDFWHIISDHGLETSYEEELRWYHVFLGVKELLHENSLDVHNREKIKKLQKRIDSFEFFTSGELDGLVERNTSDLSYFYAMKLFRAIRWFDLIGDKYIPKYENRRAESCKGFDMLLKDDFMSESGQKDQINNFINGTPTSPPGRLKYIRRITDRLTRQGADEIIKLGLIYDSTQIDEAREVFLTDRHTAEGIARINTLAACSRRLRFYRADLDAYRATSYKAFHCITELLAERMQTLTLDLGHAKYELIEAKKPRYSNYVLRRNNASVTTVSEYVSALKEMSRSLTPSSGQFYNAVQIMCLRALYTTNDLNSRGV